jgi:hypothetical protein
MSTWGAHGPGETNWAFQSALRARQAGPQPSQAPAVPVEATLDAWRTASAGQVAGSVQEADATTLNRLGWQIEGELYSLNLRHSDLRGPGRQAQPGPIQAQLLHIDAQRHHLLALQGEIVAERCYRGAAVLVARPDRSLHHRMLDFRLLQVQLGQAYVDYAEAGAVASQVHHDYGAAAAAPLQAEGEAAGRRLDHALARAEQQTLGRARDLLAQRFVQQWADERRPAAERAHDGLSLLLAMSVACDLASCYPPAGQHHDAAAEEMPILSLPDGLDRVAGQGGMHESLYAALPTVARLSTVLEAVSRQAGAPLKDDPDYVAACAVDSALQAVLRQYESAQRRLAGDGSSALADDVQARRAPHDQRTLLGDMSDEARAAIAAAAAAVAAADRSLAQAEPVLREAAAMLAQPHRDPALVPAGKAIQRLDQQLRFTPEAAQPPTRTPLGRLLERVRHFAPVSNEPAPQRRQAMAAAFLQYEAPRLFFVEPGAAAELALPPR